MFLPIGETTDKTKGYFLGCSVMSLIYLHLNELSLAKLDEAEKNTYLRYTDHKDLV